MPTDVLSATNTILITILGGCIVIIGYFLRQKDEVQAREIDLLFQKHDKDAAALIALQLEIAREHYVKRELDDRFSKLDATFREGFDSLGDKFDKLSHILVAHIAKGNGQLPANLLKDKHL